MRHKPAPLPAPSTSRREARAITGGTRKPVDVGAASVRGGYSIEVLRRAMEVLNAFDHARPAMPLKEIVALTGLPKTTVFRILATLVEFDMCSRDAVSGDYSLGFAPLRLADVRRRQSNVYVVALPLMRELRNLVGETVVLSIRAGDTRVHVDLVESLQDVRRTTDIGVPAPLYVGASAKVLLAALTDAEIDAYLDRTPLKPFQNTTITGRAELWSEVRLIRERGYAESRGELIRGGGSLAAPIRDHSGGTVAVIDILTPEDRYTDEHRTACIAELLSAVAKASARLGFRP